MLLPTHLTLKGNDFLSCRIRCEKAVVRVGPSWDRTYRTRSCPCLSKLGPKERAISPSHIFAYCCNKRVGTFYSKMELTIFPGPVRKQAELPSEGIEPRTIPCSCFLTRTKIELWTIPGQYLPKAWFVLIHLSVFQHNSLIFISFCSKNREHRSGQLHRL